jgi:hypothetical protein
VSNLSIAEADAYLALHRSLNLRVKLKGQNEGQCLFVCLLTQTGLSNLLTKQNDRRVQKCQVRKRESKTASALLIADSGFDGSTTAQFQAVLGSSINIVWRFDPL